MLDMSPAEKGVTILFKINVGKMVVDNNFERTDINQINRVSVLYEDGEVADVAAIV